VYFICKAVDGKLFDVLAADGKILHTATVEEFVSGGITG